MSSWDYQALKTLLQGEPLPAMVVDLDILDANAARIAEVVRACGKTLRIASKSVRVPLLMQRVMDSAKDVFQGVMCYSVQEAAFLAERGLDDLLIAYPTVQQSDLEALFAMTQGGVTVTAMMDCATHLDRFEAFWARQSVEDPLPLRVCIDVDMSYRPLGQHLGVQRSPVRSLAMFSELLDLLERSRFVVLDGVMGYEAQIAGLGENNPFSPLLNPVKKALKKASVSDVAERRKEIAQELERRTLSPRFFNGGGTGSLQSTTQEAWLTEVTAGAGFLQSHLFDYYEDNRNEPAFCFGLQVTRIPEPGIVVCQSGGFVASGELTPDKNPLPFLPDTLAPLGTEGFGEVQTPLKNPEMESLRPGDPVFFRPAKAGEIAERFQDYLLLKDGQKAGRALTYRGLGQCFF